MKKFKFMLLTLGSQEIYSHHEKAIPGRKTLKNFLITALMPVGKTMYTWGGGWNIEDTGSGVGSITIGLRPEWKKFFFKQNSNYNFSKEKSKLTGGFIDIDNGLDCSGFVGWTIYNTLNNQNNQDGYVMSASKMAFEFSKRGWGKYTEAINVKKHHAGDIMSSKGHVYICLGECTDGSIVIIHSSPCGVQINGTTTKDEKKDSLAIQLAEKYMKTYYKSWHEKYPKCWRDKSYLSEYNQMQWYLNGEQGSILTDPDNISKMDVEKVLQLLFNER